MDAKTRKLAAKLGDEDLAAKLVAAGLDNPRKIRDAPDAELKKILGKAEADKVRARL